MAGLEEFDREPSESSRQAWRQPWPAALDWAGRLGQRPIRQEGHEASRPWARKSFRTDTLGATSGSARNGHAYCQARWDPS